MPIRMISGLPGNGKTLRCLAQVEKQRQESGRSVYFYDIRRKGSALAAWIPLGDESTFGRRKEGVKPDLSQVQRWHEVVPSGSIVVIDECWEVFAKRPPGSTVPDFVKELATHRHRGIDFVLMSQHTDNQVDHFVRGLIQEHEHVVRLFGAQRARIHKWDQGLGDPKDYHSLKASITEQWTYPREVYDWYHSAEVHTIKRKLPWKPILSISGGVCAMALLGWLAVHTLFGNVQGASAAVAGADSALAPRVAAPGVLQAKAAPSSPESFKPAIAGVPFTAPFYAPAVKVQQAPAVAGCGVIVVGTLKRCFCNDQQGNRMDLDKRTCLRYFEFSQFRFDRDEEYYPKVEPYVPPLADPAGTEQNAPRQAPQAPSGAQSPGLNVQGSGNSSQNGIENTAEL